MSYIPQNFKDGAVLSAKELNHIEEGLTKLDNDVNGKPFVIYEDKAAEYESDPTVGDKVLEAILSSKQILVRTSNIDGGTLYANYMPVIQYQLPNVNNDYLTLFYLKDGIATNLLTSLGTGSFEGVYGELTMKLSKTYTTTPLV